MEQINGRALGALEHLFWKMSNVHPLQHLNVAEIAGKTSSYQWSEAIHRAKLRHPLFRSRLFLQEDGQPWFVDEIYVDGNVDVRGVDDPTDWLEEGQTLSQASLGEDLVVRCLVLHSPERSTLLVCTHHSLSDAVGIVYFIRDVLQLISGEDLSSLSSLPLAQEQLLDLVERHPPRPQSPKSTSYPVIAPTEAVAPSVLVDTTKSHHAILQKHVLSKDVTEQLRRRAKAERTTVHGAICAAAVIAGRKTYDAWRSSVRVVSPIDLRGMLDAGEACANYIVAGAVVYPGVVEEDFWELARWSKYKLAYFESAEAVTNVLHVLTDLIHPSLTMEAAGELGATVFARDIMVSNLGVLPIVESYGTLTIEGFYGPAVLQGLQGEQDLGIATIGGRLHLLHASYDPVPELLENLEAILTTASS